MRVHVITHFFNEWDGKVTKPARDVKVFKTREEAFDCVKQLVENKWDFHELQDNRIKQYMYELTATVMNSLRQTGRWTGENGEAIYYGVTERQQ